MDIKEVPTIGETEFLIRNSSKKLIFQGMIKEEKKPTKHLVWLLKNPRNGNKNSIVDLTPCNDLFHKIKKEMKT